MTVVSGPRLSIRRARLEDRPRVYAWLANGDGERGPGLFMERSVPSAEAFAARYVNAYFDGTRPYAGRAFIVADHERELGCVIHGPIDLLNDVVELDVWLAGTQYGGRGIASEALVLLMGWLQAGYGVGRFLARPARRNVRALRALRRAGFRETDLPAREVAAKLGLRPGDHADEVLMFRVLPDPPAVLPPEPGRTYVFVDSEFTSLVAPELISVGAVATDGTAFYAELSGWNAARSSEFVRRVVLPLLDGDAVPPGMAAEAFATWLDERAGQAPTTLVSDSGFDRWALADLLGTEDLPDGIAWQRVAVAYVEMDRAARRLNLRRHHALDDARALRHLVLHAGRDVEPDSA